MLKEIDVHKGAIVRYRGGHTIYTVEKICDKKTCMIRSHFSREIYFSAVKRLIVLESKYGNKICYK